MSTSKVAKIQIETGRDLNDFAEMTDSGDQLVFTISGGTVWSGKDGFAPTVRPSGIVTGRNVLSTHTTNDTVTIAAFTAYSKGLLKTVTATSQAITRTATAGKAMVHSITMASDGTIAVVGGTISADTTFVETRDAAGGPPLIPVYDVEIGQVRTTTSTAAAISADEIFQVVGNHVERADFPNWEENNIGDGIAAEASAQTNAYLKFSTALPLIHVGVIPKAVYLKYYAPLFADISKGVDFVPAEKSHSVTSTQYYNGTIASIAETLNAGGFTAYLTDGISDALVAEKNEVLTVKFFPNRNNDPYLLTQGTVGLSRAFPAADQNQASVTVAAESQSAEFTS